MIGGCKSEQRNFRETKSQKYKNGSFDFVYMLFLYLSNYYDCKRKNKIDYEYVFNFSFLIAFIFIKVI